MTKTRIVDKISVERLVQMTKLTSLFDIVKTRKIHLLTKVKSKDQSIVKTCLEGLMERKRSRGRPQRRWLHDIKDWTSTNSIYDAINAINST